MLNTRKSKGQAHRHCGSKKCNALAALQILITNGTLHSCDMRELGHFAQNTLQKRDCRYDVVHDMGIFCLDRQRKLPITKTPSYPRRATKSVF